jgi:flagellar capping protein FliD
MGLITRLGRWLDSRFPEKISAEEVIKSMTAWASIETLLMNLERRVAGIDDRLSRIERGLPDTLNQVAGLKDDMNKTKAFLQQRQMVKPLPNLTGAEPWRR